MCIFIKLLSCMLAIDIMVSILWQATVIAMGIGNWESPGWEVSFDRSGDSIKL